MIIFPGGVRKKMEFPEGRRGPSCEANFGKSRGEGGYGYFMALHHNKIKLQTSYFLVKLISVPSSSA